MNNKKFIYVFLIFFFNLSLSIARIALNSIFELNKSKTRVRKIKKQYSLKQRYFLKHITDNCEKNANLKFLMFVLFIELTVFFVLILLALYDAFFYVNIIVYKILFFIHIMCVWFPFNFYFFIMYSSFTKTWKWEYKKRQKILAQRKKVKMKWYKK